MHQSGEDSPIDIYPELDSFEDSIYRTFKKISPLRSGDGYITATDYISAFKLYDIFSNKNMLLPILRSIDINVTNFKRQLDNKKPVKQEKDNVNVTTSR